MNKKLDQKLVENYPKIFQDRYEDMRKTAMCWGFCCGDGWYSLIDTLCANIQSHIDHQNKFNKNDAPIPQLIAVQVKEKFGTLRFYYHGGDEYISGLVSMAESLSASICEECGNKGKIRNGGWVRTLCDHHAQELGYNSDEDD